MTTDTVTTDAAISGVAPGRLVRLRRGQTATDVWGRRGWWAAISLVLIAVGVLSLSLRWLNLGIEFEGGAVFDVPAGAEFDADDARDVLSSGGAAARDAQIDVRWSPRGEIVKVRAEGIDAGELATVQAAFAERAGVDADEVAAATVSPSWGDDVTRKAVIASVVFLGIAAVFIWLRFEWRILVAALLALVHDLVIGAGLVSLLGLEVTPAVAAVGTAILVYSLVDSAVVLDRVRDNERRVAAAGLNGADLVNISANQLFARSAATASAALLPGLAVLVVAGLILGHGTVVGFAVALVIALACCSYSSLFVAAPVLGWLKGANGARDGEPDWLVGDELRRVVVRGVDELAPRSGRRRSSRGSTTGRRRGEAVEPGGAITEPDAATAQRPPKRAPVDATTEQLLSHPPRARKKKRH